MSWTPGVLFCVGVCSHLIVHFEMLVEKFWIEAGVATFSHVVDFIWCTCMFSHAET